jgi:CHAT domain-containing protein
MTQRNKCRPALELRRKRDAYQTLACLSALLLFFSLIAAISSRQAFGGPHGLFRQSNRQSRDVGSGGSDGNEVRTLEAGKPIKGELAVGQRHVYRISLGADQFLKVVVEQQGIDVVAQVVGPDGKGILMVDSESRPEGQEEASVVAEAAGAFLLIVYPGQNETPSGSYEIRIEELRVATDTDRALHEARKQFEQALNLRAACEYGEALPFAERALEIRERLLGTEHHDVTAAIVGLAGIYTDKGEYVKAEPLYRRALDIREKALGKDHPSIASSLIHLAELYREQEKYVEAESLLKRALDINEKVWGQDHPYTANSLDNLAVLYEAKGDLVQAVVFQLRANTASERNLARNLVIGSERTKLAYLATLSAQTNRTISLHLRSAPNDPAAGALAATLILQRKGRALDATSQNLNALRSRFNTEDRALLDRLTKTRSQIARLVLRGPQSMPIEQHQARIKALEDQAEEDESDISRRSDEFRAQFLPVTLEDVQAAIPADAALVEFATYRPLNAKATKGEEFGQLHYVAYILRHNGEIQWKELGEATTIDDSITALRKALRNPKRGDVKRLARAVDERVFQPVRPLLGEQARLLISPDGQLNLIPFAALVDEQGRYLVERYSISYLTSGRDLLRLQVAIPADAALIEFATYRPLNAKATKGEEFGQPHYVAYILRHNGEIQWKELGEAKTIDDAIAALRKALRNPKRGDVKRLARAVDERVFQPARPLLGEQARLLISPDGQLNLVPFAALVDEQGRYLVERYSISYLASGRDLLRLQVTRESKDGPMVVAAPDFGRRSQVKASRLGKQEKDASEEEVKGKSARSVIREFYFPPLPYAAQEGEALRALLPCATLLTKGQATKAALSQVRSPELLHIATHSFFLEDQQLTSAGERGAQSLTDDPERALQQLEQRGIRIESPLLRSGLALAGANEHKEDDNGILTALEVTGLNLWGTKLVTLSACDTGVGEVKNGDGVHGLRRALVLAGAEAQIMSLWAVSDKATRELMVPYYRMLQDGQGRGEALRRVQLEMLKNVNRRHPYYWASFIQSGEWANLEGKR